MSRLRALVAAMTLAAAVPAFAQAPASDVAPYEKDLLRLAEILGALSYLRPLCKAAEGTAWRDKMAELMEAEGGPEDRRERLAGAFNAGYRGFELSYHECTPSAELAARRYLDEGSRLSRDISLRHGD